MTDTSAEIVQETSQQQIIKEQIGDATDRYIADLTAIGKKWAKENGRNFGVMPTPMRPNLVVQASQCLDQAIHPVKRLTRGPGIEPNPIAPSLNGLPDPNRR